MKPKTAIQKKVAQLSTTLRPITETQKRWAYSQCFEHYDTPVFQTDGVRFSSKEEQAMRA